MVPCTTRDELEKIKKPCWFSLSSLLRQPWLCWLFTLTTPTFAFRRYRRGELEIHHEADPGLGCSLQARLWQGWQPWLRGQGPGSSSGQPPATLGRRHGPGGSGRAGRCPAGCPALRPGCVQAQTEVRGSPCVFGALNDDIRLQISLEGR